MSTASNFGRVRFVGVERSCLDEQCLALTLAVLALLQPLLEPRHA
jgi:hypothetical protein